MYCLYSKQEKNIYYFKNRTGSDYDISLIMILLWVKFYFLMWFCFTNIGDKCFLILLRLLLSTLQKRLAGF